LPARKDKEKDATSHDLECCKGGKAIVAFFAFYYHTIPNPKRRFIWQQ
jgi:hypothetical protein